MNKKIIIFLFLFYIFLVSISNLYSQQIKPCQDEVIKMLINYDKIGYEVFKKMDVSDFFFWIDCSLNDYNIPTAVHESVHMLSGWIKKDINYYYFLPDGSYAKVTTKDLFYRNEIGKYIKDKESDFYYDTYLTGDSGKQDILLLLDEVNAYTFSVISGVHFSHTLDKYTFNTTRDGISTFMYYLELYLYHARTQVPNDYKKIKYDDDYLFLIKTLWENAEDSLIYSSSYKNLGINDIDILKKVYSKDNINEIVLLFYNTDYNIDFKDNIVEIIQGKESTTDKNNPTFNIIYNTSPLDEDDNILNEISLDDSVNFIDKGSDFVLQIDNVKFTYIDLLDLVDFIDYIINDMKSEFDSFTTLNINDKEYSYNLVIKIIKALDELAGDNQKAIEILNKLKDLLNL